MTTTIKKIAAGLATNRTSTAFEDLLSQAFLRGVALGQTIQIKNFAGRPPPSSSLKPAPPSWTPTN